MTGSLAGSVASESSLDTAPGDEQTRDELYARAQEMDIPGRSQMTKEQLQVAVEEQENEPS